VWNRIRATVLGHPVQVPRAAGSGRGAALLAAAAVQRRSLGELSRDWDGGSTVVEPDAAQTDRLDESYHRFLTHLQTTGERVVPVPAP
jgi:sugar (pentulose or hexulose) kinase